MRNYTLAYHFRGHNMFNWEKWQITDKKAALTSTSITTPKAETEQNISTVIALMDYSIIEVNGEGAQKFLQGQLTCDVVKLSHRQAIRGAHCTPKGRIISNFILFKVTETLFYLRIPSSNEQNALKNLKKYSVFFKVDITINADLGCFALTDISEQLQHQLTEINSVLINIHPIPKETWLTQQQADSISAMGSLAILPRQHYEYLAIKSGLVDITDTLSEALLPHDINMHTTDGISFTKGCYTGQEIIARMEYKATIKKHTTGIRCHTKLYANIGDDLKLGNDTLGKVVRRYDNSEYEDYLIFCNKNLSYSSNDIMWHDVPYAIP